MREKVIVVGAGVGGLTAAHELIERGFEVHVYERRSFAGGKAASTRIGDKRKGPGLPGEHGFRFFPSWYRHLPDTLRKIPFRGRRAYYEGATVFDNLVAADVNLLTWYDRDSTPLPMHLPRNAGQLRALTEFAKGVKRLGLANAEVSFFLGKLAAFLATPEEQRVEKFQGITWWDYVEAESKSPAYQSLISATTRTMVAAKATEACAYTIGKLAARTLFDSVSAVDRVLNGPTNEVWIEPWIEHLKNRGVVFHFGRELESIAFDGLEPRVTSLSFSYRLASDLARLRAMLGPWMSDLEAIKNGTEVAGADTGPISTGAAAGGTQRTLRGAAFRARTARVNAVENTGRQLIDSLLETLEEFRSQANGKFVDGHPVLPGELLDKAKSEVEQLRSVLCESGKTNKTSSIPTQDGEVDRCFSEISQAWKAFDVAPKYSASLADLAMRFGALLVNEQAPPSGDMSATPECTFSTTAIIGGVQMRGSAVRQLETLLATDAPGATYFVFSLPVEQMAYYINRSATARLHDPELERIVRLADATDWMAGVQFFLEEPINLTPGHIVGMDSEWGITAIEQTQFWRDISVPTHVKSILSVDVAAWDRRGREVRKEAYNCTDREIAKEVWAQLKAGLNRSTRQPILDDRMLVGTVPGRAVTFTPGLNFHVDDSIVDVFDRKKQGAYERARSVRFSVADPSLAAYDQTSIPRLTTPYVFGPRLRYNAEPLLVNRVGTHALRPDARTSITNLFLAADYVKTETDLACMEGANEAARRATNALLDAAGSNAERCQTWDFMSASNWGESLLAAAGVTQSASAANAALKGASAIADGALGMAGQAASMLKGFWEKK